MTDEALQIECALAREQAMVPAPRQDVHGERRGVGELEKEDLLPRDRSDLRRVVPTGKHVKTVEAQTHCRMVGEFDDPPRTSVVVDEPSPGEGLEGDAQAVCGGEVTDASELIGGHRVVVDGRGGDIAADENRVDAESRSCGECRISASQVVDESRFTDTFDVAQRLIEIQRQAEPLCESSNLLRRLIGGDEIGLEDLHTVEARCGARVQFLDK